jgi:hypothetical protein
MYIFFSSSLKNQKQRKPTQNFENNTLEKKKYKKIESLSLSFFATPAAHPSGASRNSPSA